jgi:hypothetical protein
MEITKKVKARHSSGSPIYGTELIYDQNQTQGIYRIMIITSYFDGNDLVGNRSVWYVDDHNQHAKLRVLDEYRAGGDWVGSTLSRAWVKHRKTIAKFLMEHWSLGKLHGRIHDEIEPAV